VARGQGENFTRTRLSLTAVLQDDVDPSRDVILLMRCHAEFSAGNRLDVLGPSKAWLDRQSPDLGAASKVDKVKPPILPLTHLIGLAERNMLEWLLCHR
jgi:hypothetical protein